MKGVSTLIIVVLLLLITISLVGFVFIFLQRSAAEAAGSAQQQQQQLQQALGKTLRIDNAAGTSLVVRHTGTQAMNLSTEVAVYINNAVTGCTWNPTTLQSDGTSTCTLASTCTAGATIKVTFPAGDTTATCS